MTFEGALQPQPFYDSMNLTCAAYVDVYIIKGSIIIYIYK